jgi:hypothetical protein
MENVSALAAPPPGTGFVTTMLAEPDDAMLAAGTYTLS